MPVATCECTLTLIGPDGSGLSGRDVTVKAIRGNGTAGQAISKAELTDETDVDGEAVFTLIRLVRYMAWLNADKACAIQFDVPDAANFDIPELLGTP
jgi:hypothetical protein